MHEKSLKILLFIKLLFINIVFLFRYLNFLQPKLKKMSYIRLKLVLIRMFVRYINSGDIQINRIGIELKNNCTRICYRALIAIRLISFSLPLRLVICTKKILLPSEIIYLFPQKCLLFAWYPLKTMATKCYFLNSKEIFFTQAKHLKLHQISRNYSL